MLFREMSGLLVRFFLAEKYYHCFKIKNKSKICWKDGNKWGEKLPFSWELEWKISTQKKIILGNDISMEILFAKLMRSLLSEHYLY